MFDLIGFDSKIKLLLDNYKSQSLHSSIIIHGPKGIGKSHFIYKLIHEILEFTFKNNNFIHHLNLYKNNTHPNIKLLERINDNKSDKKKSSISIEQIRNLKNFINESPSIKNLSKFLIIDSADDLNINSANSLLKTLEEPKQNTFIFMVSHELSTLIPTIRSRCLKIKLNKHSYENFKKILVNHINEISEEEIKFYYDLTYGCPGNAISFHDNNMLEILDITIKTFNSNKIDINAINLTNTLSKLDNDQFKLYLSILKTLLIILNKFSRRDFNSNIFLSEKFKLLKNLTNILSFQNIIDRFDFLSNNESDLLTYNLDKKLFMLKFLTI